MLILANLSEILRELLWPCCGGGGRPIFPLSWRRWSLVELKPTATEPSQDVSLVAGLQVPTAPAQHPRRSVRVVDSAHDLGVVIDSGLTISDHVTAVCRSAYYQLRQLRTIARSDARKR